MARGPAYPFISLEQAVKLARGLYEYAKRTPANVSSVLTEKWNYSPTSSSAVKVVAALRYFGLIDIQPSDKGDFVKITDRAYRILVDLEDSAERKQALKDACLAPKAYKACWDKWGTDLPPAMRSSLIFDQGFIDSTVDSFLTNYRKSLHFAGLLTGGSELKQDEDAGFVQAGDGLSAETQSTGTSTPPAQPVSQPSQLMHYPAPLAGAQPIATLSLVKGANMRQEVFALAEGDVTIQWPERMSAESLEDFTDWLRILERKIRRAVIAQPSSPQTPASDDGLVLP